MSRGQDDGNRHGPDESRMRTPEYARARLTMSNRISSSAEITTIASLARRRPAWPSACREIEAYDAGIEAGMMKPRPPDFR